VVEPNKLIFIDDFLYFCRMIMKKYILIACLLLSATVRADVDLLHQMHNDTSRVPTLIIGIGSGINSHHGLLGLHIEKPLGNQVGLFATSGLGGWGYKIGGGLSLYTKSPTSGISFTGGICYSTGLPEIVLDLDVQGGERRPVTLEMLPLYNVHLQMNYHIALWRIVRLTFSLGYSYNRSMNFYQILSNHTITSSSYELLKYLKPGGMTLGFTLGFAL
jgi:hypothetical protein